MLKTIADRKIGHKMLKLKIHTVKIIVRLWPFEREAKSEIKHIGCSENS